MRKFTLRELEGDREYQPPQEFICQLCGNEVDEEYCNEGDWEDGFKLCPWCRHLVAQDE